MHSDCNDVRYSGDSGYVVSDKPLGATGLRNLGNTCYMNAALQSLSNCPHLTEFLLQCPDLLGESKPRLATYYRSFLAQLWLPPGCKQSVPLSILREVQSMHPMFMGYGQHDSQEFLRVFLNRLHDELKATGAGSLSSPRGLKAESGDTGSTDSGFSSSVTSVSCECDHSAQRGKTKQKKNRQKQEANDKRACRTCSRSKHKESSKNSCRSEDSVKTDTDGRSIITDVFQGKLISTVRCLSCNEMSCREEPFLDLSVSLRRPDNVTPLQSSMNSGAMITLPNQFKSDSSRRSHRSLGISEMTLPTSSTHGEMTTLARSRSPSAKAAARTRLLRTSLHLNRWYSLSLEYPLSLARRFVVQLFALFTISLAWLFARMTDVRGWVYQPALSLEDCLADYFSQAELNGDNKYSCERCNKLCNGLNQYSLLSLPEVLCIHLKRFRSNYTDSSKITAAVTFPMYNLDLSPYLHDDCVDEVTSYDLIGIVCHYGGYGGGHYIAYAMNRYNQKWYEFDDDLVTERHPEQIEQLTNEAYILFYRKRDVILTELRRNAEFMVHKHLEMQSDRTVYISRPWYVRFNIWAEPGLITNLEFLCEHGNVQPQLWDIRHSLLLPIPESLWLILSARFGGGPIVRDPIRCPKCYDVILARQEHEREAFEKVHQQEVTKCNPSCVYAISASWFNSWKEFVCGDTLNIPGPIDNSSIEDGRTNKSRFAVSFFNSQGDVSSAMNHPRLKTGADYQELFEGCWNLLFDIYGGGPAIRLQISTSTSNPMSGEQLTMTSPYQNGVHSNSSTQSMHCHIDDDHSHLGSRNTFNLFEYGDDGLAVDLDTSYVKDYHSENSLSNFQHRRFETPAIFHPSVLPNGDIYESSTLKSDILTTRSAENLSLANQGDTYTTLETCVSTARDIKWNGSWHSQSAENLNSDQSLVSVPLMAGDGPIIGVDCMQPDLWLHRLQASNRKRPRLL